MKIDLELVTDNPTFASEVCIVGGGIAGLVLASKLATRGIAVHVLESGGLTLEGKRQGFDEIECEGRTHDGAKAGRHRVIGGNSTRWGAEMLTYSSDIFAPPDGTPSEAWPVSSDELERYYADAQSIMQLPATSPQPKFPLFSLQEKADETPDIVFRYSRWAPFSRRNLANTVGRDFPGSPLVTVFLHANVTSMEVCKSTGRILSVVAKNYSGKSHRFQAAQFVICAGTIETCRILLVAKPSIQPMLGDAAGNIGRCFNDHLGVAAAHMTGLARRQFLDLFLPPIINSSIYTPKFEASASLRSRKQLMPVMAFFIITEPEDSPNGAFRTFLHCLQCRDGLIPTAKAVIGLSRHAVDLTRGLWSIRVRHQRPMTSKSRVTLQIDTEQSPKGGSHIRLSEHCDDLGVPRAIVDWRVSQEEKRNVQVFAEVMGRFLNRAGVTQIPWNPELWMPDDSWLKLTRDTNHPMGGTRMGTDPAFSVVDGNLKVHGISNLFVASCSVYPSGGCANPTLTLMALALRLGDHLADLLKTSKLESLTRVAASVNRGGEPVEEEV